MKLKARKYNAQRNKTDSTIAYRLMNGPLIRIRPDSSMDLEGGPVKVEEIIKIINNWTNNRGSLLKSLKEVQLKEWEIKSSFLVLDTDKGRYEIELKGIRPIRGYIILEEYKMLIPKALRERLYPNEEKEKQDKLRIISTYDYFPKEDHYALEVLEEILEDLINDRFCVINKDGKVELLSRTEAQISIKDEEDILKKGIKFECLRYISQRKELTLI